IELAIADRLGICANVEFSFLAAWLWRQIGRLVPVAENSPFAPAILAWRLYEIFGDERFVDAQPRLAHYLREADPRMRYDLALRTASLFDQYVTYRPDWLAQWLAGDAVAALDAKGSTTASDQRWQSALWRRIAAEAGTRRQHPATEFFAAIARTDANALHRAGIPDTVHVFCLPGVPPLYLDMLRRLGRVVDVRVSALNPCREYWFDIVDRRRLSYLAAQGTLDYHEVGNRLLASWGKQRQAQLALLFDDDGEAALADERFVRHSSKSLLARVQNAILDLRDLPPGAAADIAADDRSIEVHACHSFTRELEVLHDSLLGLFAGRHAPRPSDILVVTPALDDAAPLIDAVFGTAPHGRYIPYVVTGRGRSSVNRAARALLDLLAVAASRFPASGVTELLQQPIVARRFGIDAPALERIREWIRAAGIRWGVDAKHREQCGLPPLSRHTFDDGLQRLYLGYALPPANADDTAVAPFDDRLPAGHAEGSDALALGAFFAFMRALERMRVDVSQPKTASAWTTSLLQIVAMFLVPEGEEIEDSRDVQATIGELHATIEAGGARDAIPLDVLRTALEAALDDPVRGGVPSGAVTFATMSGLRDLPYRVVCVLGLNDGAWPRGAHAAELDLMAEAPRAGDRQRRDDDRNVFLDLLLAARDRLYVSYVGRSVRDNAPLPPSVLVSELLDCLVPALAPANADRDSIGAARARLVVEHPLQPFSVDAFTGADPRKRSFNAEYCEALRGPAQGAAKPLQAHEPHRAPAHAESIDDDLVDEDTVDEALAPFFTAPLTLEGDEWRTVTLEQLKRFFVNPCAYLLRHRLRVRLDEVEEELCDEEPFVAGFDDRNALVARLLPLYLRGVPSADIRALARAGTEYPPGRLGERLLDRELAQLDAFARSLAPTLAVDCLAPVEASIPVAVDGETWQVTGAFGDLRASGFLGYRYDDVRPTDYLGGWLTHVFLNVLAPRGVDRVTTWHSRNGHYVLRPLDDANEGIVALLRLYRRGLTTPLHFFPKSAWAYVCSKGDKLKAAAGTWHGHPPFGGERDHRTYRLALRGVTDPLDEQFEECARTVFAPLRDSIVDPRLES
ncbi:MAG TPA: exodeoxyribonuclease V subunit gamma, partial [Casimicrobiaceae bacterium]|nr:exodeoxyribonuclease V subunit gamma [Casimicrobiaceae bacterium]